MGSQHDEVNLTKSALHHREEENPEAPKVDGLNSPLVYFSLNLCAHGWYSPVSIKAATIDYNLINVA